MHRTAGYLARILPLVSLLQVQIPSQLQSRLSILTPSGLHPHLLQQSLCTAGLAGRGYKGSSSGSSCRRHVSRQQGAAGGCSSSTCMVCCCLHGCLQGLWQG
jgi:hypothetical protein